MESKKITILKCVNFIIMHCSIHWLYDLGNGMCLTTGCIATATRILNAIDESIEPCDDFYQFACGKFVRETYIPDDKLTVDTFNKLSDQIDIQLRTIIEADIDPNESKVFQLVKKMHKSCMNRTAVEAIGLDAFKQIISNIGGWPVVDGDFWNETAWDWIDAIGKMKQIGLTTNYLLSTSVGAHLKNSSRRSLRVIINTYLYFIFKTPKFNNTNKKKHEKNIAD